MAFDAANLLYLAKCSENIFRRSTVGSLFGSEEDVFCSVARSMCPNGVLVIEPAGEQAIGIPYSPSVELT